MSNTAYLTVVYEYNPNDEGESQKARERSSFKDGVIAASLYDEISRIEWIKGALEEDDALDLIKFILSCSKTDEIESLDDIRAHI